MWRLQLSGYPAQDYDSNQIPRKTELCLSLSGQDFEKYISEVLYPNLAGKKFDIYKIDKQRRLIRLAKYTPRAIKDSKYQGSLIIIPYVGILILRGLGGWGHFQTVFIFIRRQGSVLLNRKILKL